MDPDRLHMLACPRVRRLSYRNPAKLGTRVLDGTLHSELEPYGIACQRLLRCGQCHPTSKEMIQSGEQGQLVDFFDPDALAQQVDRLLQDQEQRRQLGLNARQHILEGGYDLQTVCASSWSLWIS